MDVKSSRVPLPLLYLACYTIWIALSALGLLIVFELRAALVDVTMVLRFNPWLIRGIDRWGIFIFGLVWLLGIIVAEHHLRRGVEKNQLSRRAGRLALIEGGLLAAAYGLDLIIL
jgi:hypothetical protein